jgi:hypothetical protein
MANPDEVLITPGGTERMNESFRDLRRLPDALKDMPEDRKSALISW